MRYILIIFLFLMASSQVLAQLSQGGKPIEFPRLKSLRTDVLVDLPPQNNNKLLKASLTSMEKGALKPFRFAESIPVCLNTDNSGQWITYDDSRIWTLEIRSEGAKSLNLIFDDYQLPDEARLFIYSADHENVLGAFTSFNNKESGILATSPVIGDHLVVQYEEPLNMKETVVLSLGEVNHDFVGIMNLKQDRRPRGLAGACNLNVNCEDFDGYKLQASGVVRLIVGGSELCSGTLINNTKNDGTPYIYTAGHCIDNANDADETVFLFNYQSPYCGEIDGDASRSLSGSFLRARSDSLDFSLVEMSVDPPAIYHPYFLGWDRSENLPDSSACIHHPQGDIKKIAKDEHSPQIGTYSPDYIKNAFFFIGNWEYGTTEGGSSGACLIDQNGRMIGSVTGGAANCNNPVKDYFSRIHSAWNYYPEASASLKSWLDPDGTNKLSVDGLSPFKSTDICGAFTNFKDDDVHEALEIIEGDVNKGFWSGRNTYNFMEYAEKFEQDSSCDIAGVSLGIYKAKAFQQGNSKLKIKVYNGKFIPEDLVYEQDYNLSDIDPLVMNYFEFTNRVDVKAEFFVSYSLELLDPKDSLSVYLAKRDVDPLNSFYIKDDNEWYTFPQKTTKTPGSALLMEVVLCNIDVNTNNNTLKSESLPFNAFPNPLTADNHKLYLSFIEDVNPKEVGVYDLTGQLQTKQFDQPASNWLSIDFGGFEPGTYLIRVATDNTTYQTKVLYINQ